jgi:hypothetical protein
MQRDVLAAAAAIYKEIYGEQDGYGSRLVMVLNWLSQIALISRSVADSSDK